MASLWSLFVSAFAIGFSGAVVPGPMFMATAAYVPAYGAWAGPLVVLGHGATEAAVIAALAAGLGKWLSRERVLAWIGLLGGMALIGFGALTLSSARSVSLEAGGAALRVHPIAAGFITSVVNPYWIFWWATIGVTYVGLSLRRGAAGLAAFGVGHVLSDFVWFTFVSAALAFGRSLIGDAAFRLLVAACGLGLIGFGVWFIVSGARRWAGRAEADVSHSS